MNLTLFLVDATYPTDPLRLPGHWFSLTIILDVATTSFAGWTGFATGKSIL